MDQSSLAGHYVRNMGGKVLKVSGVVIWKTAITDLTKEAEN